MDGRGFDDLARSLAAAEGFSGSRRRFLVGLAGALGATVVGRSAAAACGPDQLNRRGLGCVCKTTGRLPDPVAGCPCPAGLTRCGGVCVNTATDPANCNGCGLVCFDGNACTADICQGGRCLHPAISCGAGDACTTVGCDSTVGCVHTPISCDDGDACTENSCDPSLGCLSSPLACDDGDPCTIDSCDRTLGCVFTPLTNGETCLGQDGICCDTLCQACCTAADCAAGAPANSTPACTAGACTYPCAGGFHVCGSACVSDTDPATCGARCMACPTEAPHCVGGACVACRTAADCPPPAGVCQVATCSGGVCGVGPGLENAPCEDGASCTFGKTCQAGVCTGGLPFNPCPLILDSCAIRGTCDPVTGACVGGGSLPNGTACSGALTDACTDRTACLDGVCTAFPKACPGGFGPCQTGSCNPIDGTCTGQPTNLPNGLACQFGGSCGADYPGVCNAGLCDLGDLGCPEPINPCQFYGPGEVLDGCQDCSLFSKPRGTPCGGGRVCNFLGFCSCPSQTHFECSGQCIEALSGARCCNGEVCPAGSVCGPSGSGCVSCASNQFLCQGFCYNQPQQICGGQCAQADLECCGGTEVCVAGPNPCCGAGTFTGEYFCGTRDLRTGACLRLF